MENGITAAAAAEAEATELQQPAIPVELLMCPKWRGESGLRGRGDGKQIANACLSVSKSHLRATFKM